jgi:hypothetical protein
MKLKLKAPGTKRLKLKCDVLLSTSAFKSNLHRYTLAAGYCRERDMVGRCESTLSNTVLKAPLVSVLEATI